MRVYGIQCKERMEMNESKETTEKEDPVVNPVVNTVDVLWLNLTILPLTLKPILSLLLP